MVTLSHNAIPDQSIGPRDSLKDKVGAEHRPIPRYGEGDPEPAQACRPHT